jgi:hypothetical protein
MNQLTGSHFKGKNPGPCATAEKKLNMTIPLEIRNDDKDNNPPILSFGGHHINEQ